jgi:hypothetical protein
VAKRSDDLEAFGALCRRLRRNDPSVTKVEAFEMQGYGLSLGEALRCNTHVTRICLDLSCFLPDDAVDTASAAPLARWLHESVTLRDVTFRNEFGNASTLVVSLAGLLLKSLAESTSIVDALIFSTISLPDLVLF